MQLAMHWTNGRYAINNVIRCCESLCSMRKLSYRNADIRTAKMRYTYFFESDYGMESGFANARNRSDLLAKMKKDFPNDIGSDGFAVDQDGNEFPLNW